jgi:outer membrane PBP1 activator LpoA protein
MKLLSCLLLVASAMVLAGCTTDTPAYSAKERFAQIHRNELYQSEAANDDIDWILLARPSNQETIWNVYHR